jgi:protein-tyrosine phosphatase
MIDLHAHVLPGLDDGPGDLEGALALLQAAAADGTKVIAATPHLREDYPGVRVEALADAHAHLLARLDGELGLEVVLAGEVDLEWAMEATDDQLRLASYGQRGSDMLVETPYGQLPAGFEEMLFRLRTCGYRLLLAHPERSPTLQANPQRLVDLVRGGVLVQVTASSLLQNRRAASRRFARFLVREGLVHVLASDAHRAGPDRAPGLSAAVEAARRLAPARAEWMAGAAPAAILAGKPLPPAPIRRPGRGLLRRR